MNGLVSEPGHTGAANGNAEEGSRELFIGGVVNMLAWEAIGAIPAALHDLLDQFDDIYRRYRRAKAILLRPHRPEDKYRLLRAILSRQMFFKEKGLCSGLDRTQEERNASDRSDESWRGAARAITKSTWGARSACWVRGTCIGNKEHVGGAKCFRAARVAASFWQCKRSRTVGSEAWVCYAVARPSTRAP